MRFVICTHLFKIKGIFVSPKFEVGFIKVQFISEYGEW